MHKQSKWIVWLSIWLSSSLLVMSSSSAEPKEETGTVASVQSINPWAVNDAIRLQMLIAWQNTHPKPRASLEAPKPLIVASDGSCAPHRMSLADAHGCWDSLIAQYSWSPSKAFRVMYCESTADSSASSGGHNGLFQIAGGPFDPAANVAQAFEMYLERGWQPWTCQ